MNTIKNIRLKLFPILLILIIVFPQIIYAQMFSVGDPEPRDTRSIGTYTLVGVSWEIAEMDFRGENLAPQDQANFSSNVLRLHLENPGLHISAGFGGAITGMNETSYVNINAMLFNDTALVRSPRFILSVPFQIITDLKRAQRNESSTEFQQSSLIFGTGISSRIRLADRVDFSTRITPNYGFSFSQGALFGGNLFRTNSKTRLYFNEVFGENSLSVGYDFDYRFYDIEGGENDYRYTSHALTVGIAF
ncbi:MAG: hypothetical protein WEA58_09195 [Balneolaceae bacterium]